MVMFGRLICSAVMYTTDSAPPALSLSTDGSGTWVQCSVTGTLFAGITVVLVLVAAM
jgi:hypothetical protein